MAVPCFLRESCSSALSSAPPFPWLVTGARPRPWRPPSGLPLLILAVAVLEGSYNTRFTSIYPSASLSLPVPCAIQQAVFGTVAAVLGAPAVRNALGDAPMALLEFLQEVGPQAHEAPPAGRSVQATDPSPRTAMRSATRTGGLAVSDSSGRLENHQAALTICQNLCAVRYAAARFLSRSCVRVHLSVNPSISPSIHARDPLSVAALCRPHVHLHG